MKKLKRILLLISSFALVIQANAGFKEAIFKFEYYLNTFDKKYKPAYFDPKENDESSLCDYITAAEVGHHPKKPLIFKSIKNLISFNYDDTHGYKTLLTKNKKAQVEKDKFIEKHEPQARLLFLKKQFKKCKRSKRSKGFSRKEARNNCMKEIRFGQKLLQLHDLVEKRKKLEKKSASISKKKYFDELRKIRGKYNKIENIQQNDYSSFSSNDKESDL